MRRRQVLQSHIVVANARHFLFLTWYSVNSSFLPGRSKKPWIGALPAAEVTFFYRP